MCQDCNLQGVVREHQKKLEKIVNSIESINIGIHGTFEKKGIKGRVDMIELVISNMQKGIDQANKTASRSLNILIAIAITLISGVGLAVITFLFNLKKGG